MNSTRTRTLIALLMSFILGVLGCYCWMTSRGDHKDTPTHSSDSTSGLLSTTGISAEAKTSTNDPDLVMSQKYTAVINGEKVSVPIVKRTTGTTNQPTGAGGSAADSQGVKASVEQTIDLTNVLSRLRPSWELGAGVSYMNKDTYVPISIQRNYADDKALELTVLMNTDGKAKGAMVQHKWLIK